MDLHGVHDRVRTGQLPQDAAGIRLFEPRSRMAPQVRWLLDHATLVVGAAVLVCVVVMALLAPWLGTVDPMKVSIAERLRPPSSAHWFGTDILGRDLYSRVVYGARISLLVGFSVALITTIGGLVVGLLSGYLPRVDAVLMRIMDGAMSIPPVLLAIALMAVAGPSIPNVIAAIALADLPRMARLVRGVVLSLRTQPFIEAAHLSGSPTLKIIGIHLLPNAVGPVAVQATYVFASAMIVEAVLSFLGAGAPAGMPSWGNIIAEGRALWQVKPHLIFVPAAFLSLTVLAVNLLGDGVRDFLDPRMAKALQR